VATDLDSQAVDRLADHELLFAATQPLFDIIDDQPSLENRLAGTGRLDVADARALACTGYVGKASGQGFDVRRDSAYAPYDLHRPALALLSEGDVGASAALYQPTAGARWDGLDGYSYRVSGQLVM
jgi:Ni,Fe-hydrogenase III large subunit